MKYEKIEVAQEGLVGVIRLNEPATLNAISELMLEEVSAALDALGRSSRALLLTANGRAFCSGANLTAKRAGDRGVRSDAGALLETHVNPLMTKLSELPIPWISAVPGPAVGVGCSIALGADLVVAAQG